MGDGAGNGRQVQQMWRRRRGDARDVAESLGGVVAAVPPAPTVVDRLSVGEAASALDISAATLRRRIRAGELKVERAARRGDAVWAVRRLAVEDEAPHGQVVSPDGPPPAAPFVERVVHAGPAAAGGLAVWCSLAALAQQLAAANAGQARARQALEREHDRLVRENVRLTTEMEYAATALASEAEEYARAVRRAKCVIAGLSLAVAALGALLLVLGPLAAVTRLGV